MWEALIALALFVVLAGMIGYNLTSPEKPENRARNAAFASGGALAFIATIVISIVSAARPSKNQD